MKGKSSLKWFLVVLIDFCYVTGEKSTGYDLFDQLLKYLNVDSDVGFGCKIDISRDLGNPSPLFIRPASTEFFHPTERSGIFTMKKGDSMEIFCTNGFAYPLAAKKNLLSVGCENDTKFRIGDRLYNFNEFICRKNSVHSVRINSDERCFNNAVLIDIGFQVEKRFLNVLTVCHNPLTEQTYYAQYELTPAGVAAQQGFNRPKFMQGEFFPGKDINDLYTRNRQRKTISKILKSEVWASKLVEAKSDVFLSRGHLAARGDFIYANEQRSTFNFINVAPQWQSFNGLNWRTIEDGSRRLSSNRNITLKVYTGTHGVIKFNDTEGIAQEIYLDYENKKVPVPKIFYKILIDEARHAGIVLVGVNNPHVTMDEINRDYVFCNDVSHKIKYLKWRATDIRRGFSYACEVDNFLREVPHLPNLHVSSLLV